MSNIEIYKQNTNLSVPERDNEIQVALESRMIKDVASVELFEILKAVIIKAYIVSRYTSPVGNELTIITDETLKKVKSSFGAIRERELPIIFTRGVAKEYGDYKGLSFPTFIDWFRAYLKEESRIKLTTPVTETKEPTLQERFTVASKNAMDAFLAYQSGKDISLVAPSVYRFLRGIRLFQYSDEEQEEFMGQAKLETIAHLNNKKATTADKFKRLDIGRILENLNLEENLPLNEKVVIQAKRLGLYAYFQTLIMEEADLQELINQHKPQI